MLDLQPINTSQGTTQPKKLDLTPIDMNSTSASLSSSNYARQNLVSGDYFKTNPDGHPLVNTVKDEANLITNTAVGMGKTVVNGAIGTANMFQRAGQVMLGGIDRLFGGKGQIDTQHGYGIKSIDNSTDEGQAVQRQLQSSNTQQTAAGYGEIAGEMVPGVVEGLPRLKNLAQSIIEKVKTGKVLTAEERALQTTINALKPKLTAKELKEAAISGKGNTTLFGKSTALDPKKDERILEIAHDTAGMIKGKSAVEDINNVRAGISDISEKTVRPFLSENLKPFNFEDLRTTMERVKPSGSFKGNTDAVAKYNQVRERVLGILSETLKNSGNKSNLTDYNELWDARKVLDSVIEDELGSVAFDTPEYNGVKAAAKDMRASYSKFISDSLENPGQMEKVNQIEDFIQTARQRGFPIDDVEQARAVLKQQFGVENLPEDEVNAAFFKDQMKKMSNMYEAIDNLSTKVPKEENTTAIQRWAQRNPGKAKALKYGAIAAGGYEAGNIVNGH